MLHTVEGALAAAYKRSFNPPGEVTVKLDTKTGALDVRSRIVGADGTVVVEELQSEDFKRMAAQTAKHAVLRHIHDLERDKVLRAIAREPGLRTKIAVSSTEPGLDPVGACVGPKGVRHRAILSELANEHVDIVPWSEDAEALVAAALGPARADRVTIDRATRTATVLVPRGQLSLAIGRDGQNARLAAKLTGYRIDIKPSESDDQAPAE